MEALDAEYKSMIEEEKHPAAAPYPPPEKSVAPKKQKVDAEPSFASATRYVIDMDGPDEAEKKEDIEHNIECEMKEWLNPASPFLKWYENTSQPSSTWPQLQSTFPCLALLARRFLCLMPTSAASERVWSGVGHIIANNSSCIDSLNASHLIFLRRNKHLLDLIPP